MFCLDKMDTEIEEKKEIIIPDNVVQKTKKSPLKTYSRLSTQNKGNATG